MAENVTVTEYTPTAWVDHTVERPKTYEFVDNEDGTKTLVPSEGEVLAQGTPLNAKNLNKLEEGLKTATQEMRAIAEMSAGKTKAAAAAAALPASGWASGTQTVQVEGVTQDNIVLVTAAPDCFTQYNGAGVYCSAQGAGTLTFAASKVPTVDLTAQVLILS